MKKTAATAPPFVACLVVLSRLVLLGQGLQETPVDLDGLLPG